MLVHACKILLLYARIIHVPRVTRSLRVVTAAATSTGSMKTIRGARLMVDGSPNHQKCSRYRMSPSPLE
eukprot:363655-Chlamydomonas_euryale.AAC.5